MNIVRDFLTAKIDPVTTEKRLKQLRLTMDMQRTNSKCFFLIVSQFNNFFAFIKVPQLIKNGIELRILIANGDIEKAMVAMDDVLIDYANDGSMLYQVSSFKSLLPVIDYELSNLGSGLVLATTNPQKASCKRC